VTLGRPLAWKPAGIAPASRDRPRLLPRGRTLPVDAWRRRHRVMRALLWAHLPALVVLSCFEVGFGTLHEAAHGLPILAFALLSGVRASRRVQSATVAAGLLTASATVVHTSGGQIEAHFHFFVVVSLLTLYEDWLPFGMAVAFVGVHHLVGGLLAPEQVFGTADHPLLRAAVHTGAIAAAALAGIVAWRANEDARDSATAAHGMVETQYEVSRALAAAVSVEDAAPRLLSVIGRGLGADIGLIWRPAAHGLTVDHDTMWFGEAVAAREPLRALAGHPVKCGEGLAGRVWETGEPAWTHDLAAMSEGSYPGLIRSLGQRAGVALPIRACDDVLGILSFTTSAELQRPNEVTELLGSICSQLAVFMDRLRRTDQLTAMEDAARTDPLTGLANRRLWDVRLDRELAVHRGRPGHLSVLLIDIDRFKVFNDTHGHQAGDELLRAAARAWTGCTRTADLLARLGGDEFALLCPGTPPLVAHAIADRLRASMPFGEQCSVGVATWDGEEPVESLIERADRALYAAKRRDRAPVDRAAQPLTSSPGDRLGPTA
jgi:diguanylate cyclase (GGDEF)-like protein